MTTHKQNDPMISRITQELDAGLDQLDPSITSRLREGRSKALEQTVHKPFWERLFVHPRQLAGFATAAALLVMVMYWHPSRSVLSDNRVEEMELLEQQGSLDMYQDLDFYAWLATTNETH